MIFTVFLTQILCVSLVSANIQQSSKKTGISQVVQTVSKPWPLPQAYKTSRNAFEIDPLQFRFTVVEQSCDILEDAFARYMHIIFGNKDSTLKFSPRQFSSNLGQLNVVVKTPCNEDDYLPSLELDESYTLYIDKGNAYLNATEVWGALRGLETFSQIVWMQSYQYFVNSTQIKDFPRFKHRGILLDTSRHFLSVDVIKENIEIMAENKFNVFHWHVVDDPSFPFESLKFPELTAKGAYPPASDHTYTQQDVKDIIEFARYRGVRVIPEFDTPGHTQSWGKGLQQLLTPCYTKGKPNGLYGPVDPSHNSTWTFIKDFFSEIRTVFKDHFIHLGGDEVSFDCWKSNPKITEFMKDKHISTYYELEAYYVGNLMDIIEKLQRSHFVWQEVFDNNPKVSIDTVVHVWKEGYKEELAKVTKSGYKALLSSCWYLDYISYGPDWEKYYICDPQDFVGTEQQKELVMGGEACLWGEWVDDSNVVSRLWPRASAVAERLWSSKDMTDVSEASRRLEEHRCRLIRRGFAAEPANGPGYCKT